MFGVQTGGNTGKFYKNMMEFSGICRVIVGVGFRFSKPQYASKTAAIDKYGQGKGLLPRPKSWEIMPSN